MPLWIVILRLLLRDRPGPATALGVLIGLGGVALIFLPGGSGETDLGYAALAVLAALSWAVGSLLVTLRPVPADPLTLTTVQMAAGGLVLLVAAAAHGELARFAPGDAPGSAWFALCLPGGVRLADRLHRVRLAARQRAGVDRRHLRVREPGGGGAARCADRGGAADRRRRWSAAWSILAAVALVVTAESRVRRRAAEPAEVS